MGRIFAFCLGVCLSASAVARAEIPADQSQTLTDAEKEARLRLFVKMGDQARLAGRNEEAATAYKAALDIQPDPIISGRLGLVLMKLGQLDRAGEELYEAVVHGQSASVSTQERREIAAAYDKAKALTTWVDVDISHAGAKVTCDGLPWNRKGFSSFWRFAMPGEHTLHAHLDGYKDAVATFTANPGEEIRVSLKFESLEMPKQLDVPRPAVEKHGDRNFPPMIRASNVATDSNYDPREDPSYGEPKDTKPEKKKTGPRFTVSGGVVTVFGVASWNPAVGGVLGVAVKPKEFLSLGLEGRAAWLTTGVADRQISAMTAGGILSACGHLKWFFGCGLGHLGAINVQLDPASYKAASLAYFKPGVGGRIGARVEIGKTFSLQGAVDALWFSRGTRVVVEQVTIVDQPSMMVGTEILGGWEF
ncbi:MAG TPA: hypothetical protein PK156_33020 [Polyangium sp.]|nr:hypothetical protein [Polyangium sp.]